MDFFRHPETPDNRPLFAPSAFREDVNVYFAGCGDDVSTGTRFTGQSFKASITGGGDTEVDWQFIETVSIIGGSATTKNAVLGDHITFELYSPATNGTSGSGDYIKAEVAPGSGLHIYVPYPGGNWILDLEEKYNDKVSFTKVVPVPNSTNTGYFDLDSDTGAVTVNDQGKGKYDLFDFPIDLARFVASAHLLGDHDISYTVPAYNAKAILPHWHNRVKLHQAGTGTLEVVWRLILGRKNTQP